MANEACASLNPADGCAENRGAPSGTLTCYESGLTGSGLGAGAAFHHGVSDTILFLFRVGSAVSLTTGLTLEFAVADEAQAPAGGLVSYWGVTYAPIASGTTLYDETVFANSTEDFVSVTMASAVGGITVTALASVVAHMHSLAAGNWCLARFRRAGGNANDTDTARVILFGLDVRNT